MLKKLILAVMAVGHLTSLSEAADVDSLSKETGIVEVPLFYTEKGHIFVKADIAGLDGIPMILDTAAGAGVLPISEKSKIALKEDSIQQIKVKGAGGVETLDYAIVPSTQVQDTKITDLPYVFKDLLALTLSDGQVPGILGHPFLSRHCVEFDFKQSVLRLSEGRCAPERTKQLRSSEFYIEDNIIKVKTGFKGNDVVAILDTGSAQSIVSNALESILLMESLYEDTASGLNGNTFAVKKLGQVSFHIGKNEMTDVEIYASDMPVFSSLGHKDQLAMLLGLNIFKQNKLLIDYYQNKIYF